MIPAARIPTISFLTVIVDMTPTPPALVMVTMVAEMNSPGSMSCNAAANVISSPFVIPAGFTTSLPRGRLCPGNPAPPAPTLSPAIAAAPAPGKSPSPGTPPLPHPDQRTPDHQEPGCVSSPHSKCRPHGVQRQPGPAAS